MPDRLAQLADAAIRLARGEASAPVPLAGDDDVAKLARALAQIATKLAVGYRRKRTRRRRQTVPEILLFETFCLQPNLLRIV